MKRLPSAQSRFRELGSLIGALILALSIAIFSYQSWRAGQKALDEFDRTQIVVAETNRLLSAMKDAETGQRGFLLTGRDPYLAPYRQATLQIPQLIRDLSRITASEPKQVNRVNELQPLIQDKLDELAETIRLRRANKAGSAMTVIESDRGKAAMDRIRDVCADLVNVTNSRAEHSFQSSKASSNQGVLVSTLGAAALFALLGMATVAIQRGTWRRLALIQELHDSEQQVRESRDWLATTLSSIGDAVIATDHEGRIKLMNDVAQSLTGWKQEEAAGRPLDQVFLITNEETGALVENPVSKVLREGRVVGLANHTQLTSKNGDSLPIDDTAAPIFNQSAHLTGVVLIFRDIRERKQAELAIREREEQFQTLANAIPQLCFMASADGSVSWYNEGWYRYTGTTLEQMQGWGWQSVHDPQILPLVLERWRDSVSTGKPFEMTFPLRSVDGIWRPFLTRVTPVHNSDGTVLRWFGTNTDVSTQMEVEQALRRTNANLRRANSDLEQFAYSASHDLQEPIRNIAIYGEMIKRRYSELLDAKGKEFLGFVTEGAQRMELLVKDLLAYTQVASNADQEEDENDASAGLAAALSNLSQSVRESGAEITYDALPKVRMRTIELQQLFQNLIGNAIKYRKEEEPSRIHITARCEGGMWRFSVQDNGIGIALQYKDTIFGIFKRLHAEAKYSGTGIGLAICQKIVERHGGRIWVDSEVGKGATFIFTLPVAVNQ